MCSVIGAFSLILTGDLLQLRFTPEKLVSSLIKDIFAPLIYFINDHIFTELQFVPKSVFSCILIIPF